MYEVAGLDDESITGFVRSTQLLPRDSPAPVVVTVDAAPTTISPNGDDSFDTTDLSARFSETVDWTLRVTAADGTVVRSTSGTGQEPVVTWAGLVDRTAVADGTYTYTFRGQDAWQNAPEPVARSGTVKVDATPPALSDVAQAADELPWFSPNGDGSRDTFALKATTMRAARSSRRPDRRRRPDPHVLGDGLEGCLLDPVGRPRQRRRRRPGWHVRHSPRPGRRGRQPRHVGDGLRPLDRVARRGEDLADRVLPAGPRLPRLDRGPVVRDQPPGDGDLDDPQRGRRSGRHANGGRESVARAPTRSRSTVGRLMACCCQPASTPRT